MAIKDRIVEIIYDLKDRFSKKVGAITGGMRDIERSSDRTTKKLDANSKRMVGGFGSVGGALSKLSLGFVVFGATVGKVVSSIKDWISAANVQQRAETKLETTLKNLTGATDEQIKALKDQASALQDITGYGDEATISAQAMLGTFGLTADQIALLTPRLLDTAEGLRKLGKTDIDLEQIAIALGKSISTGAGALTRFGVTLTDAQKSAFDFADKAGKVAILAEILDGNYRDAAVAVGEEYDGAVRKASAAQGDFYEALGRSFTQNKNWIKLNELVTKSWKSLTEGIDGSKNSAVIVSTIAKTLAVASHLIRESFNIITIAFRAGHLRITESIEGISNAASKFTVGKLSQKLKETADSMRKDAEDIRSDIKTDWLDIGESTDLLIKVLDDATTSLGNTKNKVSALGGAAGGATERISKLAAEEKKLSDSLKETTKTAEEQAKEFANVKKETEETREKFAQFVEEMKRSGDALDGVKLIDVVGQMNKIRESLRAGDFDGAIKGAEAAEKQIRKLKESGEQGSATIGSLADKLKKLVDEATKGKEQKELIDAQKALSDVDAIKAKLETLSGKTIDVKMKVDTAELDIARSQIKPIEIPVTYRVIGSLPDGLTISGEISNAANKGGL
jgi:hypothetical protein